MQELVISRYFGKGFLANSQYCLKVNEINCKPKKGRKSKKAEIIQILTTEKINITNINVNAMTNLERYKLECEEYGHNVRNTQTKRLILDF